MSTQDPKKQTDADARNRRRWPRVALTAQVIISYPSLNELVSGPLSDLSQGGAFIRTLAPKPEGTRVKLKVSVDRGRHQFTAEGVVVRVVKTSAIATSAGVSGMGIAFDKVDEDSAHTIHGLVRIASTLRRSGS